MADFDASSHTLSNESVQSEESVFSEDDMSSGEMNEALRRATARLKAQQPRTAHQQPAGFKLPKLQQPALPIPYMQTTGQVTRAEAKSLVPASQRSALARPKSIIDPVTTKLARKKAKDVLPGWYNLPRTDLNPELKRDLQLLHMRSLLDSHRMYKKQGKFKVPEFSQVGVLVEGPTEFFNGRVQKKNRKKTFVEDALATEALTGRFKKKFGEVQASKMSGKKAFYKALKARRKSQKG